jgi:TetR/AcrR family transcriptional repressor of nem operon
VGYDSFSYHDISHQLRTTNASIHYHFPKKEDLGLAACQWIKEQAFQFFDEVKNSKISNWKKLDRFIEMHAEVVENPEGFICPLSSLQAEISIISNKMRAEVAEAVEAEMRLVEEILKSGKKNKEMKFPGSARGQATVIWTSLKAALQLARLQGKEVFYATVKQLKNNLKP